MTDSRLLANLAVRQWIENELRAKLNDDDFIRKHAALLVVGKSIGSPIEEIMRRFVASVVLDAAGMNPDVEAN